MAQLEYKSLVTKEIIDYYISIIKDEKEKKALMSTISKFDIRIATEPIIDDEDEKFYYKIWIWRRGTRKRAHIKRYNKLELLKKEGESKTTLLPSLAEILGRIRFYANVPEDFEEYCEKSYRDPSDETSRAAHPRQLKRAERFKKFITKEEIKSIPSFLSIDDEDEKIDDEFSELEDEEDLFYDLDDEDDLIIPFDTNSIFLKDKIEYDKLKELRDTEHYYSKIVESYGYNPYTGDYDTKKFPITKEDKQKENIDKDFDNYFQASEEFDNDIKELIKKYNIKPKASFQRLTFKIHNNTNSKQPQLPTNLDLEFITVAVNLDYFPTQ